MHRNEPTVPDIDDEAEAEDDADEWTVTGTHPPGACVTLASSTPKKRGMLGPVRSTSNTPTERPDRESVRAS